VLENINRRTNAATDRQFNYMIALRILREINRWLTPAHWIDIQIGFVYKLESSTQKQARVSIKVVQELT